MKSTLPLIQQTRSGLRLLSIITAVLVATMILSVSGFMQSGGKSTAPRSGGGNASKSGSTSPNATLAVTVSLPHVTGPALSIITVPITVGDLTGQGVTAYDLQVSFNSAIVQPDTTQPTHLER